LSSLRRGDNDSGTGLLQLAIIMANLAPLLTWLTIAVILVIIVYLLNLRSKKSHLPDLSPTDAFFFV
jgi:hypothetical protein